MSALLSGEIDLAVGRLTSRRYHDKIMRQKLFDQGITAVVGILEIENNTAERGMRAIAIGRKNWLFAGSERGGRSAAIAYTLP